jgi:phage/plasmid-like protein (TIGR03299 family)
MAHGIMLDKGDTMVSGNGQVPWHKLGTVVEGLLTARECLTLARLGWEVEKRPLYYKSGDKEIRAEDRWAVVRTDTGAFLGDVGARYTPIQNVEGLDILDPVIGREAHYETAGSLFGGRLSWFLARVGKDWIVSGDTFKQYILVYLSHDGKLPVTARFVTVRVVCWNTLSAAIGNVKAQVSIRHTRNFRDKIEEAHRVMKLQSIHSREFEKAMAKLAEEKMGERAAWSFLNSLIPSEEKQERFAVEAKGPERSRNEIFSLYREGKGNEGKTRYDMLNGVTEYVDHKRSTRLHGNTDAGEQRFEATQLTTGAGMKEKAFALLMN